MTNVRGEDGEMVKVGENGESWAAKEDSERWGARIVTGRRW